MILLDKPFVSEFLLNTISNSGIKVVRTPSSEKLCENVDVKFIDPEDAATAFEDGSSRLYSNSEDAIGWIAKNLPSTELYSGISVLKDKFRFRKVMQGIYPEFRFEKLRFDELPTFDTESFGLPLIVKPATGFFSEGVHKVVSADQWEEIVNTISSEMSAADGRYALEVLDSSVFIVEECIEGAEFATDVYFDDNANPVILDILEHPFSSDTDVSDRVYYTSASTIRKYHDKVMEVLTETAKATGLKNFPVHCEFRAGPDGRIIPIEFNPMRFAGLCTTDIAWHAWGINPYRCFFENIVPDWNAILERSAEDIHALVILDRPLAAEKVSSFDYNKAMMSFEDTLELRKLDWKSYPLFGYMFVKTQNMTELENILGADMTDFIETI